MPVSKKFEMPLAYLGQMVRWKPHPENDDGAPALVTALGAHCLGLLVFYNSHVGGVPYDGVLHETDPKFDPAKYGDRGVWGYTEDQNDYITYAVLGRPAKGVSL